jgi:hypothetical protein
MDLLITDRRLIAIATIAWWGIWTVWLISLIAFFSLQPT